MRYIAEVRFIASIYPGVLPTVTRFYGPSIHASGKGSERRTEFKLAAVERGERPFILPVHDSFEEVLDVMALSALRNRPDKPRQSKPVQVDEIVADLINEWTGRLSDVPAGARPGVSEVHLLDSVVAEYQRLGRLPDSVTKSKLSGIPQEEYTQLVQQQTEYFEYWFGQAEMIFSHDLKAIQTHGAVVNETMRLAATWLGHRRPWTNKDYIIENTPCPLCTTLIPQTAIVCPACHQQIRQMPAEIAALQAQQAQQAQIPNRPAAR